MLLLIRYSLQLTDLTYYITFFSLKNKNPRNLIYCQARP